MRKTPAIIGSAVLLFALTGCMGGTPSEKAAPESVPPAVEAAETTETETAEGSNAGKSRVLAFGEGWDFEDGMYYAISEPQPFEPTAYAAGATLPNNVYFTVTVTNGTEQPFEVYAHNDLTSGSQTASQIFDSGNPVGDVGMVSSTLLPGQTVSWIEAWSVADPADMTLAGAPGYDYVPVIWSNAV